MKSFFADGDEPVHHEKLHAYTYWKKTFHARKRLFWREALFAAECFDEEVFFHAKSLYLPYLEEDKFVICLLQFEKDPVQNFSGNFGYFVLNTVWEEVLQGSRLTIETILRYCKNIWILVLAIPQEIRKETLHQAVNKMVLSAAGILQCLMNGYYGIGGLPYIQNIFAQIENLAAKENRKIQNLTFYVKAQQDINSIREQISSSEMKFLVHRVKTYIDNHFCEMITRERLSEFVYLSSGYLDKVFKMEFGKTLWNYVIDKRIEYAKELLAQGEMTVSEISSVVGYDNYSYFTRLFKNKVGASPRDYRKEKLGM